MKLKGKAKGSVRQRENALWAGITEEDFIHETDIEDKEIGDYDKENMTLFIANANLFRHLPRLADSLKPVERRALVAAKYVGATPGHKTKSAVIVAAMMKNHPHGDAVCYSAVVNMAQPWKRQCVLFNGKGNFASVSNPEMFAHYRYTEAYISKYAQECFFSDFDDEAVETIFNSTSDTEEPMVLPTKFPNVLVNGGMGIATGNNFKIPPFNIDDIITVVSRVIKNPLTTDVFIVPDFPCDCDIIDDGTGLHDIIDKGVGNIKMRGRIEIEPFGSGWMLRITSVPWMVNMASVLLRIRELAAKKVLFLEDIQPADYSVRMPDGSIETRIDTRIIISGAYDPNVIREKLYSMTELEKTAAVNFKVVTDNLQVRRFNMKDLITTWINERRSYKRRLYTQRLVKIDSRLDILDILIQLLTGDKLEKTIKIIRNADEDDAEAKLMKLARMNSFQAKEILDMKLRIFNASSKKKFEEERKKLREERKEVLKTIESEKRIDDIILDELLDLRKYGSPRRTNVITPSKGVAIADTMHNLIVTKEGFVKKLAYNGTYQVSMGAFRTNDYPIHRSIVHNMDSIIFFDTFGRYSVIPVHEIDNNEPSQYGHNLFTLTKLSGKVVSVAKHLSEDAMDEIKKLGKPYLITVTINGYLKKTPFQDYLGIRSTKGIRAMKVREDDQLAYAGIIMEHTNLLVYTAMGNYVYLKTDSISEQAKDSMGLLVTKLTPGDSVVGVSVIGADDDYILVVTDKGICKRCETKYFGNPVKRSANAANSYLTTLEVADAINYVGGIKSGSGIAVCTRTDIFHIGFDEIPDGTRKAKGKKVIPLPNNANIINVFEEKESK